MRAFIFLIIGVCSLAAHAETPDSSEPTDRSSGSEVAEIIDQESQQSSVSPWQGTWTGSELDTFGTRLSVTANIRVTNGKVSGTWNVRTQRMKSITGQVNGKEAAITILQGGSLIKATLIDENTFEYSGMRGFGTLNRQE